MNKNIRRSKKAAKLSIGKDTIRYLSSSMLKDAAGGQADLCWITCTDNGTVSGGYPCCTNSAEISY